MKCRLCPHPARHWDWFHRYRGIRLHWTVPTCSPVCLELWKGRRMIDPNPIELAAMRQAGDRAGDYIDSLGRTDMAAWSKPEWAAFIAAICGGYVDALIDQQLAASEAARKVTGVPF